MSDTAFLIRKLTKAHSLEEDEYRELLLGFNGENAELLAKEADLARKLIYGNKIYIRGLIEISNICDNDCLYCGIRHSNTNCKRYRLLPDEIFECTEKGYSLGFRTFVLQSGESGAYTINELCGIIKHIKSCFPDCAVTLSLGELTKDEYISLYEAGADRYLLRHETADKEHYEKLHPDNMSFNNRMQCLIDLKDIGYQTGCGFMVGSPYQTVTTLAKDLKFIETFLPEMCGIGPFIPHKDTPFYDNKAGTLEMTLYLLSIIRLIKPDILLPATTALGTIDKFGRQKGIRAGANVIMPNLSPEKVRGKYELYDNKLSFGGESAQNIDDIKKQMEKIGYEVVIDRGDIKNSCF